MYQSWIKRLPASRSRLTSIHASGVPSPGTTYFESRMYAVSSGVGFQALNCLEFPFLLLEPPKYTSDANPPVFDSTVATPSP